MELDFAFLSSGYYISRIALNTVLVDLRSVSSLAWFMSNQENSFVTIGQRVLANPLK